MEERNEEHIRIKIAITLQRLLQANKKAKSTNKNNLNNATSYNQIALNADIRKATVSSIFNAQSTPNTITLFSIIEAMGFTLREFSEIYENLSIKEIISFKRNNS